MPAIAAAQSSPVTEATATPTASPLRGSIFGQDGKTDRKYAGRKRQNLFMLASQVFHAASCEKLQI
jgi:hypothetical protein